jgi:hypothetical protein
VPRFLVEVPHTPEECEDARSAALPTPTWLGCGRGTHTSWSLADLPDASVAWRTIPGSLRDTARVIEVEPSFDPGWLGDAREAPMW